MRPLLAQILTLPLLASCTADLVAARRGTTPDVGSTSEGCGLPVRSSGAFERRVMQVGEQERVFYLRLPDGYEARRAYPLIFRFHGYGGDGMSGGLGIEGPAGRDAIIVSPDASELGWSRASEEADLAFFDAMYEDITTHACADLAQVFAYGFSMGGGMTNVLGCRRAEKLRGIASVAGFDTASGSCARPVSAWFLYDRDDHAVPLEQGTSARDRILERAHCSTRTTLEGSCTRYPDCDAGDSVVWCETAGRGHDIAGDTAPRAVWDFFRTLTR